MTEFWVDNFDVTVENDLEGSAVNTNHLMAFQQQEHHDKYSPHVPVETTKKRKFSKIMRILLSQ